MFFCFFLLEAGARRDTGPSGLFPVDEKIVVDGTKSNGQTVTEEK